jgi:hypothetical protein
MPESVVDTAINCAIAGLIAFIVHGAIERHVFMLLLFTFCFAVDGEARNTL